MLSRDYLDQVSAALGGWPADFGDEEIAHGLSVLAYLVRERMVDEVTFGMACRYAGYRSAHDRFAYKREQSEHQSASAGEYLSGAEQRRAFYENKLISLEREILATPKTRAAADRDQSSFLDQLEQPAPDDGGGSKKSNVTPFQPLAKRSR